MTKVFGKGESTKPLVELLMAKLNLGHGSAIDYKTIEDIIDVKWPSPRFRTVTNAWRKAVESVHKLVCEPRGGKFHFLTAVQHHLHNNHRIKLAARSIRRVDKRVNLLDPRYLDSDEQRGQHVLHQRHIRAMRNAGNAASRGIAMPKPVTGNPRRVV